MKRELRQTSDGSSTLFVPALDEHYHSIHGALQESLHVFIEAGFKSREVQSISILEIGFGTGLNAWLTAIEAAKSDVQVEYTALEKYPLSDDEVAGLNYAQLKGYTGELPLFNQIHATEWESLQTITRHFSIRKMQVDLHDFNAQEVFDLIYFDAFAPSAQPDLWTEAIFNRIFIAMKPGGNLVTYCAKGQVKRNMKAAGFVVEALPGPPGKREMTRAIKA
jgi:tRNA U34 5-methylaminomethyl-2-thiouridine-forming methyltransferase MnmC